jgi:putative ABC transport system permease protein
MNAWIVVVIAVRALLRNKMRSFLTMLGVIIGVGAVVSITAIAAGARARVNETFESMGSNMLVIRSGSSRWGGVRGGAGTQPTLTWDDLDKMREEIPFIRYSAPVLGTSAQVMAEGANWSSSVQGTTGDYFDIRNWKIASGRGFTPADVEGGAKVAIVGKTVVDQLFGPWLDPVGEIIRVNRIPFEVIGVAESKGNSGWGGDQDDVVFVPVSTFRAKLQGGLGQYLDGSIFVSATSQDNTSRAEQEITRLLRARHRIRTGEEDDFSVRNLSDIATSQQESADTMTALLGGIALVSLIVGGIGIMNIMLVSVTERTREIGLRMAVGAKPRSILTQFLTEAVVLSSIGGVLGVGAGLGTGFYLVSRFGWPMLIDPGVILVAVGFSALVGIGFGLYPAFKASRFDPIQALRYE